MRVYEYSKQFDIPTKTVLEALGQGGFVAKSHMAVLTDDALAFLKKKFSVSATKNSSSVSESSDSDSKKKSPITHHQKVEQGVQSPIESIEKKQISSDKLNKQAAPLERAAVREVEVGAAKVAPASVAQSAQDHKAYLEMQTAADFALATNKPVNDVILTLLRWGVISSKNQLLSEEVVARLARHYELTVQARPQAAKHSHESVNREVREASETLKPRLPIVVVIGHVDHGKTTLLDYIRKTRVASREKGGITQHLGAYQVKTKHGDLVLLDTPGHEAFSRMRQRGVRVADIAVLVVAADDGVMPQTVEAIKHARQTNVPLIIAANKIDKVGKERLDVIKRQLSQHEVLVEDWGGSVVLAPLSAKTGEGVDQLLDMIILQTQLMDLRADHTGAAKGFVLESHLEKGLGPVATIIVQHGILHAGDYFSCGQVHGRVTALTDSFGKKLAHVEPSIPVQVAGLSQLPDAGDFFQVITKDEYKKIAGLERRTGSSSKHIQAGAINLLIKTDTNSSKEALLGSIEKISKGADKPLSIIHAAAGDINESDIELAYNTGAEVIGLHVKAEAKALQLAHQKEVTIHLYDIIYRTIEALELKVKAEEKIPMVKTKIGEARVLKVFDIKKIGVIAGCIVTDGRFVAKEAVAVGWRGNQKIGEGKITSLQREKKSVKEVHSGFECGFIIEGISDWKPDDRVECYLNLPAGKKVA